MVYAHLLKISENQHALSAAWAFVQMWISTSHLCMELTITCIFIQKWRSNLIRILTNSSGAHDTAEAKTSHGSTLLGDSLVHDIEHLIREGAEVGVEGVDALVSRAQDGVGVLHDPERRLELQVRGYIAR